MDGGRRILRAPGDRPRPWARPALAALAGIACALVALRLLAWGDAGPWPPAARLEDWFDPAAVDADRPFRRGLWALAAAGALVVPAAAILAARAGGRWRPAVVRAARARPWRAGLITGAGLAVAVQAALLPVAAARYAWGRHHGVIVQPAGGWLADRATAAGIQVVVLAALGAVAAALIARRPRDWWAALAAITAALAVALIAVAPLAIAPLFERTMPLRDSALRADVLALADRAGVDADEVRVSDASARTTAANARVAGLGAGRRIVLYDTLVDDFPPDQVRAVIAHELAHVAAGHIPKGTAWVVVLAAPAFLLLFAAVAWRTGTARPRPGAEGCDLVVRRVAVLAAGAAVLAAVALPLQNAVSRSFEREADRRALELTGDPDAAIALQQGLVARSRNVPDPPAAVTWWFGSHPPALERIGMALERREAP